MDDAMAALRYSIDNKLKNNGVRILTPNGRR
ncbi:hypothetical protein BN182_3190001 [Clostridioides difficile E9]|nr:hypothetical protein BN182_3190001 [Clostridioides difficile E9]